MAEQETVGEADSEAAYGAALESAVRSLGQREHGRRELERKLCRKGHPPELVARVLDYLVVHGLQSDDRFAEGFVRSRVQKGYGPVKIRQELASRGVDESALERQLTEPADYWLDVAHRVLARKFGRADRAAVGHADVAGYGDDEADRDSWERREDRRAAWNARARFLARRGFPADLIYRVLGGAHD